MSTNDQSYGPDHADLRLYSSLFRELANRIETCKQLTRDVSTLRYEIGELYPIEGGRLFDEAVLDNCVTPFVPYLYGQTDKQYWSRIEDRPEGGRVEIVDEKEQSIAFLLRGLARFFELLAATEQAAECEIENREKEIEALYSMIWFLVVRWLATRFPERFRPDTKRSFHGWVDTTDPTDGRLSRILESGQPVAQGAEKWLRDFTLHFSYEKGESELLAILRAHADIQTVACRLLAEKLEHQAFELESSTEKLAQKVNPLSIETDSKKPTFTDPIPIAWLREHVLQKTVKGDASKLALWLKRRRVCVVKIADKNYAEREALLGVFQRGTNVHSMIKEYNADRN